jgi:hypothetical protein
MKEILDNDNHTPEKKTWTNNYIYYHQKSTYNLMTNFTSKTKA